MAMNKGKNSWLNTPPSDVVSPPVETRVALLPFDQISWQNFERLCFRLVRLEADVEHCTLYGVQGETQSGIDIFARIAGSEKYRVYQCKNEADFGPAKIIEAVEVFVEGEWLAKSDMFVLCTRESLRNTNRATELETQAQALKAKGIILLTWDQEELLIKLKSRPDIVDDFFGRAWVKAFCGEEAANILGERLDVSELKKLRTELFSLYDRVFNIHDKGIPLSDTLPLNERFIIPDIEDTQTVLAQTPTENPTSEMATTVDVKEKTIDKKPKSTTRKYSQRISIENWITRNDRSLIFGNPGSGKSTFLRFLALDILNENPIIGSVADKWGSYLPVWIPFALWTKIIHQGQLADSSVKGVLVCWLKSWSAEGLIPLVEKALKDKRLLLLIDGLDEHSNNDAAKIALNHLDVFLNLNKVSVIATTRPHGFEKLGMKTEGWQQANIADFSTDQQNCLASIWFKARSTKLHPSLVESVRLADVERQSSAFFTELRRSNELLELARNPLLLCLLISFQISNIRLPLGRFEAYAALTDHLILTHPQARRVASQTTPQQEIAEADLKKALAHLANNLHVKHPEGLILEDEAQAVLVEFLTDGEQGLGMIRATAIETARNIISRSENSLGILVKKSPEEISFYHRTMQEYLVSFNVSRLSLDKQIEIVTEHSTSSSWREILLGLFQITKRPDDVKRMIEAIKVKILGPVEEKIVDDLLSEVVFGNFNCPPNLARDLAEDFFKKIELGTWTPHREKILRHVLDGLRSSVMGAIVRDKINYWFPNRLGWGTTRTFDLMSRWDIFDDLESALFRGLNAEDYKVKIAAVSTLARLTNDNVDIGNKLVYIADHTDDQYVLAAATEGLIMGWKNNPALRRLINRCAKSQMPLLSFVGIKGKISLKINTDDDMDELFKLAGRDSRSYLDHNDLASTFITGWPKSEKIKQVCLESVRNWGRGDKGIDQQVALPVLLEGYPMDEDVANYCIEQIEHQRYAFNISSIDAFSSIAKNFKDHPKIVGALDVWVNKQEYRDVEVSKAALVGRTATFKKHLIEGLKGHFPHWPARALLEGWGMQDIDVSTALLTIVNGPADKASDFGHLLPKIILDTELCKKRCKEILNDPACVRYDFMIDGLVELGGLEKDPEIITTTLSILKNKKKDNYTDGLKADLIKNYGFDSRVRQLAIESFNDRESPYWAIAFAFGADPEIRKLILKIATPLPTQLRQTIALYLSEAEIDDDFAISVLSLYDHETNEEIKVQASIGYHTRFKNNNLDTTEVVKKLAKDIICYGPDYKERRLAAFCGLTILGRLDIMSAIEETVGSPSRKVRIDSLSGLDLNIPFIQFLLKNWELLKNHFKDEFWTSIFDHVSGFYMWNKLAIFGDEYPLPKQEILNFLSINVSKRGGGESLLFLSRVQPGSPILLEYCLGTLGLSPEEVRINASPDTSITYRDEIVAAEIIGEQFSDSKIAFSRINDSRNQHRVSQMIMTLSEGWPNSTELAELLKKLSDEGGRCSESTAIRFYVHKAGTLRMFVEIKRLIRMWSSSLQYRPYEAIVRPLVRRLQKDDKLISFLIRYINITDKASEKVSLIKLIYKAKGLTPDLKSWSEKELKKQLSSGLESGMDITTGEFSSVTYAIYEIFTI